MITKRTLNRPMKDVTKIIDDIKYWHPTYRVLAQLVGKKNAQLIYEEFKGTQLSFPVKLIDRNKLTDIVSADFDGSNYRHLARECGYSERHIKRIVKQLKENEMGNV